MAPAILPPGDPGSAANPRASSSLASTPPRLRFDAMQGYGSGFGHVLPGVRMRAARSRLHHVCKHVLKDQEPILAHL